MSSSAQSPRDLGPEGLHNSDGGTRAKAILPVDDLLGAAVQRLARLDDQQLGNFVRDIDNALADARNGSTDNDTDEVVSIAAAARVMLRRRQQAAARTRALAVVLTLISTETYK